MLRGLEETCYQNEDHIPCSNADTHLADNASPSKRARTTTGPSQDPFRVISEVQKSLQVQQARLDEAIRALHEHTPHIDQVSLEDIDETNGNDQCIKLEHVQSKLPDTAACDRLIEFYFHEVCRLMALLRDTNKRDTQLSTYTAVISRIEVAGTWERLKGGYPVRPRQAACVCLAITSAALMVPKAHPLHILDISSEKVSKWLALAGQLDWKAECISRITHERQYGSNKGHEDIYESIKTWIMFTIFYMFSGQVDMLWIAIGRAVRRGTCCGLFDERHHIWQTLTDDQRQQRIACAYHLLILDRWQSFISARPYAIHPSQVRLPAPANPDHTKVIASSLQMTIVEKAYAYLDVIDDLSPSMRYHGALDLEVFMEQAMRRGLLPFANDSAKVLSERGSLLPYIEAFSTGQESIQMAELVWLSSITFIRCMVTRRFLTDEDAPVHLRCKALEHATCILATAPAV